MKQLLRLVKSDPPPPPLPPIRIYRVAVFDEDGNEVYSERLYGPTMWEGDICTLTLPKLHFKAQVEVDDHAAS